MYRIPESSYSEKTYLESDPSDIYKEISRRGFGGNSHLGNYSGGGSYLAQIPIQTRTSYESLK